VVLIELGGDDLILAHRQQKFERDLDTLLNTVATQKRTVVMFEIPLFVHRLAYGPIQRKLAQKYQICLIPKRYLIDVISGADTTSDRLHLSRREALRMTALVQQALSQVLTR